MDREAADRKAVDREAADRETVDKAVLRIGVRFLLSSYVEPKPVFFADLDPT